MDDKTNIPHPEASGEIAIVDERTIRDKIYIIRGVKVMLDFDLAEIYGYTTKAFNQQVRNNISKFDEDFRFQLTRDEYQNLRSKILTSSWGGMVPFCFRTVVSCKFHSLPVNGSFLILQSVEMVGFDLLSPQVYSYI